MAHLADHSLSDCFESGLQRVRYFPRQLLTADDMLTDQDFVREKLRRHNFYLHGWGTVCGLNVEAAHAPAIPWRVKIEPGYALGPFGHEIYVAEPVFLNLAECGPGAVTDPCEPGLLRPGDSGQGETLFLAIKYAECLAQPVRAMPAGCACDEEACEYSRIRDSFQIECLSELPPSHSPPPGPLLCDLISGKKLPICPPCPAEPWVVLARVTLPASPSANIAGSHIDNFTFRRQVFSTAVLQEQLIKCCCEADLSADLQIEKTAVKEPEEGQVQVLRYFITVKNNGPSAAQNVVVTDEPEHDGQNASDRVISGEFFPPDKWKEIVPGEPLLASLGVLAAGEEVKLRFAIKVSGATGTFRNIATVSSDTPDPDESNNRAETVDEILPMIG